MWLLAAVYREIVDIECREVEVPEIGDKEVLIRMKAAALHGTDIKIYRNGHRAIGEGDNGILGCEAAREIVEYGRNVTGYR